MTDTRRLQYPDPETEPRKCLDCGLEGSGKQFATGIYYDRATGEKRKYRINRCQSCKAARYADYQRAYRAAKKQEKQ